jgi:hypothetical protein
MEISRLNYEIWLIDLLDGNLNDCQAEQLQLFLNQNPDLEEEYTELNSLILKPSKNSFTQKDQLIKSISDLSGPQFDYLCIACHENDLDTEQKTELKEIIGKDPEKKRAFELIQKMRLSPENVRYEHKKNLIRLTPVQKVIRLSVIGLTIAASVAMIILINVLIPLNQKSKLNSTAHNILADSTLFKPFDATVLEKKALNEIPVIEKQKKENQIDIARKNNSLTTQPDPVLSIPVDSLVRSADTREIPVTKVPAFTEIILKEKIISNTLVAFNSKLIPPAYDDEQSKLSKFIAKTFREKILKETVTKDGPLKAYEIAEAGVSGLNKLLGWEMALDEKIDENGELSSVYFSSKILKFNAPIKKTDPLQ